MLIGEVARSVGLPSQTIRFYEREGLLPRATRAGNGYRVYDESALNRVRFIRAAQSAGLTLAEIHSIVDVRDHGDAPCAHVTALLQAKLDAVQARKQELDTLALELEHLLTRGQDLDPGDCTESDVCQILTGLR
jgi:MerR family transcriptional regulator, mercuric resistance operon regulatory protein